MSARTTWAIAAGAGAVAMVVSAAPSPADAGGAIPDSARMAALRRAVAAAPRLRVRGDFGVREITEPLLDSSGVRSARWEAAARTRPALFTTPDAPHPPVTPPIPWSGISSLQTMRPRKLQGAVAGGVIGLIVGLVAVQQSIAGGDAGSIVSGFALTGSAGLGAVLGTFIGSHAGGRTIYRAQAQETN